MAKDRVIELYRILKSADPKANFSNYETVIRNYETEKLKRYISTLNLPSSQADSFVFFEPKAREILALHSEISKYLTALDDLVNECRQCIERKIDIGNLNIEDMWKNGKIDFSTVQNVEIVTDRLRRAREGFNEGIYYKAESPLSILLKPALKLNHEAYVKEFSEKADATVAEQLIDEEQVGAFFKSNGYSFVPKQTLKYVVTSYNNEFTKRVGEIMRKSKRGLVWSMMWRTLLLFVVLALPTLLLNYFNIRLDNFEWYAWILYILIGLATTIATPFIFGTLNDCAYRLSGNLRLRMFLAPFIVSCVLLAAVLAPVAIYNGTASIVFASIYYVLFIVGTVVKYNVNAGNDCNSDNEWAIKTILGGIFITLFSCCFGNLLLDNNAAYLTVNILSLVGYVATIIFNGWFFSLVDSVDADFPEVMSFMLPIGAFVVGQIVQYKHYLDEWDLPIVTAIFGEIPLFFLILSTICCALCTAVICWRSLECFYGDKGSAARGWIYVTFCSASLLAAPCFAGLVGIVALPILGYISESNNRIRVFGTGMPLLFYILGTFVQYYIYINQDDSHAIGELLVRIPLWLQIVATVAGAAATVLTIIISYDDVRLDYHGHFVVLMSVALGAFPMITGIPLVIIAIIILAQKKYYQSEKYHIAPVIISFCVGQIFLYLNLMANQKTLLLFELAKAFGASEKFVGISVFASTLFGLVACVLTTIVGYYWVSKNAWLVSTFCVLMTIAPALVAVPFCLIMIVVTILSRLSLKQSDKQEKREKRLQRSISAGVCIIIAIPFLLFGASNINFTVLGKYSQNGVYFDKRDGSYYVDDCDEDKGLLIIPKAINGCEVAGVSDKFKEKYSYVTYNLNYEFADADNDAGTVLLLKSSTQDKFPVPRRNGYTFYGWWTSPVRSEGKQFTDDSGGLVPNYDRQSSNLYAMWFGKEYRYISSLDEVRSDPDGHFVLLQDIVIEGDDFVPICGLDGMEVQSWRTPFSGVFDGNYHTVKYSINYSRRYSGLFSWIGKHGVVRNLGVDANIDVKFVSTSTDYFAYAGGIAAINDGLIENCWATGSIKLTRDDISVAFAAGIAGASGTNYIRSGAIVGCYNLARIESQADDSYASGILGSAQNDGQTVSYCYNRGTIKATGVNSNNTAAGGIISHGRTHADNCFNAGAILTDYSNKQSLGGILGFIRNTSEHNFPPTNCAWLKAGNCQAQWGVGKYPNDDTGGNNNGVTVVTKEDQTLVNLLNGEANYFVLSEGKLHLAWEQFVK